MTEKKAKWLLGLVVIYILLYFTVIFLGIDFWGIIMSAVGALGAFFMLWFAYKKLQFFRTSWLMASLACLSWSLADVLWIFYDYRLGINPEELTFFMFLYLLPNLFIALAVGSFFIHKHRQLNFYQLLLDVLVIASTSLGLIWILFFHDQFQLLLSKDLDIIATFLYILLDFFALSVLFILYVSRRLGKLSPTLTLILSGIILYTAADLFYAYQFFHDLYFANSISDVIFIAALLTLASAGIMEICNPAMDQLIARSKLPDNFGSAKRMRLLLLIPILIAVFHDFKLSEVAFLVGIILVHQALSGYVQSLMENEYLLKQEKEMNTLLEQKIKEHTKELIKANQELDILATRDYLTGLYNRRFFQNELDQMINTANWSEKVVLLFMDLDRFKAINDSYGHDIGDQILVEVTRCLKDWLHPSMLLARIGGDEFVIAMKGHYKQEEVENFAQEIDKCCNQPITIYPYEFQVSLSIGISCYPTDTLDRGTLMKNADIAMYHAKSLDHTPYVFFDSHLSKKVQRKHELELLLKKVNFDQEFALFYQPQFRLSDGKLIGMEALLRWHSKEIGNIPPGEFIPIAEEVGVIVPIGDWVMENAITQIALWNRQYELNLKMGINISPKQLDGMDFIDKLNKLIEKYQIKPSWLDFEITESSAMSNVGTMKEIFAQLARIGVSSSIDDFGTGYSSLSYIKDFAIDRLKIAKPLIDNIATNYSDEQIVNAIIMMTKAMGLNSIAEGVETQEQLQCLISLGCSEAQGYLYSRPIPANEFAAKYLHSHSFQI